MSEPLTFTAPYDVIQEVGDDIRVVRLSEIAWIPTELAGLTFVMLGRDVGTLQPEKAQIAIVHNDLPMLEPRRVFLVDCEHKNPWVNGILAAADALRRKVTS